MKDIKLREAFRALVRHLNLRVDCNYWEDYTVENNPPQAGCNLVRRRDLYEIQAQVEDLQEQVAKLTSKIGKKK